MLFWRKNKEEKYQNLISEEAVNYYIDQEIKEQYLQDGYVIIRQFVSESIISQLGELITTFSDSVSNEFAYSTMICSEDENIRIHHQTSRIVLPLQEKLFKQFKAYSSTFLIKPAQSCDEMHLHQDWSFTDEEKFVPTTFWLPLQDVDESNGAIFLIRESHRFFRNKRSDSLPTARIRRDGMLKKNITTVSLKKGDLLLFNPAIFHGSYPNKTSDHRVAFTMTVLTEEAPLLYYNKKDEKNVEVLGLNSNAFLTQMKTFNETNRIGGNIRDVISYQHRIPSENQIYSILKR